MSEELKAICPMCTRTFVKRHWNQIYCCQDCAADTARENIKDRQRKAAMEKKRKRRKGMSELAEINQRARAAGMTYGKYVELEQRAKVKVERRTV